MTEKYSKLSKDRSGAQIQHILYAYIYCYKNNIIYKGACTRIYKREIDNYRINNTI